MKSFLHGKRSLEAAPLRAPHQAVSVLGGPRPATPEAAAHAPTSQVELVKQGDKVVRIIVTCPCGERTEIECIYPPGQ